MGGCGNGPQLTWISLGLPYCLGRCFLQHQELDYAAALEGRMHIVRVATKKYVCRCECLFSRDGEGQENMETRKEGGNHPLYIL